MLSDLKFAFRQLGKSPGFTIVAIVILALGIGANSAIFSVVNSVLLEPLPYPHSDRLVQLCESPEPGNNISIASGGAFVDWQDRSTLVESMAAAHSVSQILTGAGEPIQLDGLEVSAAYFHVFGIVPALGRDFRADDDLNGGNPDIVILSHELWESRFGGDPAIVGKYVTLDRRRLAVIGILPPKALFASTASFFTPSMIRGNLRKMSRDYDYVVSVVGRLKPGATAARASDELTLAKQATRSLYPTFKQKWTVGAISLHEQVFGNVRPYVLMLLAAVSVVLLIACANVANLLLARATVRQSEIAVRVAMGASTGRIVRQLLTESIVLALAGGIAGLVLADLAINPLVTLTGIRETTGATIGINARVLFFTLAAAGATGLLFGIVPAWTAARPDVNAQLKEGLRGSTSGKGKRIQGLLLVGETALTVLLLVCVGLLLRSFVRAMNADPGFNPESVLVFNLEVSSGSAPSTADKVRLQRRILERLEQIPGVSSGGMGSSAPMYGNTNLGDLISREDRPLTRNDFSAGFDSVGGAYFKALQIPLERGRLLRWQDDTEAAPKVLVVNDSLAHMLFGDEDPIGHSLHFKNAVWQIVGEVGDVRRYHMDYGTSPEIYFGRTYFPWSTCVVLRTLVPPLSLVPQVRSALHEIDPEIPLAGVGTMIQAVSDSLKMRRIILVLLGIFAATALVLACVGIYGVLSYSVAQRTREVGIRMALGAGAQEVIGMVMRQAIKLVAAGIVLGILAGVGAGFVIASMLYEVSKADPLVMAVVTVTLLAVASLACWIPASRAARINPIVALRSE